jgi:hypothetical protein
MTCSDNTCGTGIGTVTLPGDPSNESIVTALPMFGGIEISWTLPSLNAFAVAYTQIFRSFTNNFNAALMIANASGDRYFDRYDFASGVFSNTYYWIRFVSVNGTVGEPIGWAVAMPLPAIDVLLDQLAAKIDYSTLSVELKGTVDKADLYKQAQEAVNTNITSEQVSIRDALALVQSDLENSFVLISNEVTARQSAEQAFASSINTLAVATEENLATAQTSLQASIDTVTGDVSAMYTAKLTVNGLVGGFGLVNDGDTVEAGFDVDTFWVGRTNSDKKKPFIIADDQVWLNKAAIAEASIELAMIDKATIQNLSAVSADMGTLTAGKIQFVQQGAPTSYMTIDAASQSLQVWNSGVMRVRIGKLS